jgi:HK97 family phage major capsid protein
MEFEQIQKAVSDGIQDGVKSALAALPAVETKSTIVITKDEADKPFRSLGEQLQAVKAATINPAHSDPRLAGIAAKAVLGLNEGIGSEGGFLLQDDFEAGLFKIMYETGEILRRVRRTQLSGPALSWNALDETSRADGSRFGGLQTYWIAEAATKTAGKPAFRRQRLELEKLIGVFYATDELLTDAPALNSMVSEMFSEEMYFVAEDAVVNGNGAGQPLGILNAAALVTVAKEAGQAADTIVYENILKMWSRMHARSRPNAAWFINQDCEPQLNSMSLAIGTGGVPVYLPPGGLSVSPYASLMGRPVIPVEYCQTVGDKGDIYLADFSQYRMIENGGIEAASSIHVQFLTDQTVFRFVMRLNGVPMWSSAVTPKNGSNTLSPFVTLAVRA